MMMMKMTEKLSLTCDRLMSHRQLACCASHCCIPLNGKELLIYSNPNTSKKPLLLTGHHGDISGMVFGRGNDPVLLCSASADYIIVWDIERCQKRAAEGRIAAGTIVGTSLGEVDYLAFSLSDQRIAACSRNTVYILSSKKEDVMCTLTGHLGPLTCAEFCPWNIDILVTTSEDRTFKVWDLTTECVHYQSFVLSASPLLSVCFLEDSRQLITGSSEGQLHQSAPDFPVQSNISDFLLEDPETVQGQRVDVWCFSLPDDHKCHLVTRMDLQKMQKRLEKQLQLDTAAANGPGGVTGVLQAEQTHSDIVETSKPVLRMSFCRSLTNTGEMERNRRNSCLWIGSSDGLYLVDLATSDLLAVLYFKEFPKVSISMAGSWSISPGRQNSTVCLVSSMFAPCVVLVEVQMPDSVDGLRDLLRPSWTGGEDLTVVPSAPPRLESPLHAAFKQKEPTKKGSVREQPLVFHSNVRSSGYTSSPRRNMFSPKTNIQKTSHTTKTKKKIGWKLRDYPANSTAPSVPHTKLSIAKKPVCCFQYSGNGKHILCGLGDGSVLSYKSSLTGKPGVYTGHGKAVRSVGWSHSRQWWLSASEDQVLQIWPCDNAEPVISMSADKFSKSIKAAQFYYLDKFLLMASGPSLYLYLCHLDRTRDDIKRYQQRSVLKLVGCLETPATEITAMSAINDFFSYIVLACGSDRSIQVFDMNKGAVASELPDAHSRAIHCITQNKGSMFSTQAPDSYNLFLTSAVTDGVKLWDLRTLRCVRRYESHVNRCHPCAAAISPCGRFIASGSEDNCAYVYDICSSSYIHKLQRHSDTVLNVTFNPAMPESFPRCIPSTPPGDGTWNALLTGTLDGELSVFHPSTGTSLSPES